MPPIPALLAGHAGSRREVQGRGRAINDVRSQRCCDGCAACLLSYSDSAQVLYAPEKVSSVSLRLIPHLKTSQENISCPPLRPLPHPCCHHNLSGGRRYRPQLRATISVTPRLP